MKSVENVRNGEILKGRNKSEDLGEVKTVDKYRNGWVSQQRWNFSNFTGGEKGGRWNRAGERIQDDDSTNSSYVFKDTGKRDRDTHVLVASSSKASVYRLFFNLPLPTLALLFYPTSDVIRSRISIGR